MPQTRLKNQKYTKIMPDDEAATVPGGIITSDQAAMPPNCYIVPMVVLDKPIPIKKRKRRR